MQSDIYGCGTYYVTQFAQSYMSLAYQNFNRAFFGNTRYYLYINISVNALNLTFFSIVAIIYVTSNVA